MPRSGAQTREKILDAAHVLALRRGFGATSIDRIIEAAAVTKGAFFYHFANRGDLRYALVERYARNEDALAAELLEKAQRMARDPLQKLLIFVGLFEDLFRSNPDAHPGCLFASFVYEAELNDARTNALVREAVERTRTTIIGLLEDALATRRPAVDVDLLAVADMFTAIFEGAFVLARTFDDPHIVARQLALYRQYLEMLFANTG